MPHLTLTKLSGNNPFFPFNTPLIHPISPSTGMQSRNTIPGLIVSSSSATASYRWVTSTAKSKHTNVFETVKRTWLNILRLGLASSYYLVDLRFFLFKSNWLKPTDYKQKRDYKQKKKNSELQSKKYD